MRNYFTNKMDKEHEEEPYLLISWDKKKKMSILRAGILFDSDHDINDPIKIGSNTGTVILVGKKADLESVLKELPSDTNDENKPTKSNNAGKSKQTQREAQAQAQEQGQERGRGRPPTDKKKLAKQKEVGKKSAELLASHTKPIFETPMDPVTPTKNPKTPLQVSTSFTGNSVTTSGKKLAVVPNIEPVSKTRSENHKTPPQATSSYTVNPSVTPSSDPLTFFSELMPPSSSYGTNIPEIAVNLSSTASLTPTTSNLDFSSTPHTIVSSNELISSNQDQSFPIFESMENCNVQQAESSNNNETVDLLDLSRPASTPVDNAIEKKDLNFEVEECNALVSRAESSPASYSSRFESHTANLESSNDSTTRPTEQVTDDGVLELDSLSQSAEPHSSEFISHEYFLQEKEKYEKLLKAYKLQNFTATKESRKRSVITSSETASYLTPGDNKVKAFPDVEIYIKEASLNYVNSKYKTSGIDRSNWVKYAVHLLVEIYEDDIYVHSVKGTKGNKAINAELIKKMIDKINAELALTGNAVISDNEFNFEVNKALSNKRYHQLVTKPQNEVKKEKKNSTQNECQP